MELDLTSAGSLGAALAASGTCGNALAALEAAGIHLPGTERLNAQYKRGRTPRDPTTFVMDEDLVVRAAAGESILRLPWFDEEMFVGRQLPDVREIPRRILHLAVDRYRAALAGQNTHYSFTSYGHTYSVYAVPLRRRDGSVEAVMAVATPVSSHDRDRDQERSSLTPREIDVLVCASYGLTYMEIADRLIVSPATIKTHLANIYEKLGVNDKAAAVAHALRHGLID